MKVDFITKKFFEGRVSNILRNNQRFCIYYLTRKGSKTVESRRTKILAMEQKKGYIKHTKTKEAVS